MRRLVKLSGGSAVVVFSAGKKHDRVSGDVELQPLHVGQVFALDMNFDGVVLRHVEHLVNIVVRRDQRRDHARFVVIYAGCF